MMFPKRKFGSGQLIFCLVSSYWEKGCEKLSLTISENPENILLGPEPRKRVKLLEDQGETLSVGMYAKVFFK